MSVGKLNRLNLNLGSGNCRSATAASSKARASASDLAHGLKTPLAILSAEGRTLAESGDASSAREIDLQVGVMNRHIERQLARARARGQSRLMSPGTELAPAFEKLVRAFRGRKGLASAALIGLILLALILPMIALGANMVETAAQLSDELAGDSITVPPPPESVADAVM